MFFQKFNYSTFSFFPLFTLNFFYPNKSRVSCWSLFSETKAKSSFADNFITVWTVIEENGSICIFNFLYFLANWEKGRLRQIFEESNIFKEIVLKIDLECDLTFPKFKECFFSDFD